MHVSKYADNRFRPISILGDTFRGIRTLNPPKLEQSAGTMAKKAKWMIDLLKTYDIPIKMVVLKKIVGDFPVFSHICSVAKLF